MSWFERLRNLMPHTKFEHNLDEELRSHLQMRIADNLAAGMPPEQARYDAQKRFGNATQLKADTRDADVLGTMETTAQDLRYGLRMLRKKPGFTAAAVLTLALGIGASTAVFSVVSAILLKPLPYPHAERIVIPWRKVPAGIEIGYSEFPWGRLDFQFFASDSRTLEHVAAFQGDSFNLTGAGEPARIDGLRASAAFFPALGVSPALGRAFTPAEDQPGHDHEVLLSDQLWRERFGADPQILGRVLELNGDAYTIIGVMPRGFAFPRAEEMPGGFNFPRAAQLWVPIALRSGPRQKDETSDLLAVLGRMKPGITIQQVQAEMDVLARQREKQVGVGGEGWFFSRVASLPRQVAGDTRQPLLLILCAVGVVLLIACANVASLLLTRSLGRRREFTLRAALGAGHARLVRQLLTESLLLAAAGGCLGILLAQAGVRFVTLFGPSNIPRLREVALDWRVFAFALAVTLLTGILFGLAPALSAARENLAESLKEGGQKSSAGPARQKIRNALLVSEVALALVLVIAAGLLTRSFSRLLRADGGFRAEHVLTFELSLPPTKYADVDHVVALYHTALDRLQSVPGIEAAGLGETVPLGGAGESTSLRITGRAPSNDKEQLFAAYTIVSPGYFSAVGTPILRGRGFLETDTRDSLPVAVISSTMAKKYWPRQDPLGQQVGPGSPRFPAATIVGIAADAKHLSLREESGPEMYVLYDQKVYPSMLTMELALRTKSDPAAVLTAVRAAMHQVDPDLPLAKVTTLTALLSESVAQPRFTMLLLGSFGALALLLAAIGIYGVISYSVMQRTQEIGIRMALGAQRRSVFRMVVGRGARLAGLGIALGLVAALGVTRLMTGFLYGIQPADPLTFAAVPLGLLAVALFACYLPARRATRVDPMVALHYE